MRIHPSSRPERCGVPWPVLRPCRTRKRLQHGVWHPSPPQQVEQVMTSNTTRLGVIGMGPANMASTLTLLADEPDLRYVITAVCGLPEAVIENCARDFGVPFWTTDYRQLVARDDVDVVCVFSPDALHAEHCIAALEHGKHVVCTKPMVTRLDDAKSLVRLVRDSKVKFLVGQTMRFDPQFLHAKQYFDDGQLGDLIAIEIINVEFLSGAIGRVAGLYGVVHPPIPMYQFGVYGTRGSLQAELTDNEPGQIHVVLDANQDHRPIVTRFEAERDRSAYGHGATVIRYMRHFQDCLDHDREPSPSVVDGAKSVAVGVAAWESIRSGKVVEVCNEF